MLWWLAQNTLVAAALAGAVVLACRALRLGPAARHALWVVVLAKLVTPPLVVWPWAVGWPWIERAERAAANAVSPGAVRQPAPETPPSEAAAILAAGELEPVPALHPAQPSEARPALPAAASSSGRDPATLTGATRAPRPGVDWLALSGWIWAAGSLLMILLQWKRIRNMQALVADSSEPPAWLARDVVAWSEKIRVRAPPVRLAGGISSPMIWGLGRPLLLWPAALADPQQSGRWQGVLVHELAHLRRRDHWVGWLELLAGCLWWPNPLFWYVRHQIRENAELSCDAWVVGALPEGRRAYAEALLHVCEFARQTAPLPAVGVGGGTRRAFERRLTMILKDRVAFRLSRWSLAAVAVLAVLTLPSWTQSQDPGSDDSPREINPFEDRGNPVRRADQATGDDLPPGYPNERRAPNAPAGFRFPGEETSSSPGRAPAKAADFQPAYNTDPAVAGQTADSPFGFNEAEEQAAYPGVASAKEIASLTPQQLRALEQQLSQMLRAVKALHEHRTYADEPVEDGGHVVATTTFTLTKTTYSLPDEKGDALQAFLLAHVGEPELLRITRDGDDQLTVVASPEAQRTIGDLILLMKTSPAKSPQTLPEEAPEFDDAGEAPPNEKRSR